MSKNWYTGDKTTFEGSKIELITSQFGLDQIINRRNCKWTHIQGKYVSCVNLIFISTKFGYGFGYPLVSSPKLTSSDSIC